MKKLILYALLGTAGFFIHGITGTLAGLMVAATIGASCTESRASSKQYSNRKWASDDPIWDDDNADANFDTVDSSLNSLFINQDPYSDFDMPSNGSLGGNSTPIDINPATGLPMIDGVGGFDIGGNPYGFDNNDLIDHNTSFDGFNQNSLFDHNSDSLGGSGGFD